MSPFTLAQVTSLTLPFRAGFAHFSQGKMTGSSLMHRLETGCCGAILPTSCYVIIESKTLYFSGLILPFMHSFQIIVSFVSCMHFLFVPKNQKLSTYFRIIIYNIFNHFTNLPIGHFQWLQRNIFGGLEPRTPSATQNVSVVITHLGTVVIG